MTGPLMPGSILSMPAAAAERLIRLDSGDAALLYLYLLGHGNAAGMDRMLPGIRGPVIPCPSLPQKSATILL